MGGVCSAVRKKESAEGSGLKSKKIFKTVKSFRKTKVGDVNDQNMKSTEKNDSSEPRISFLRQLVPTPPRKTSHARKSSFLGKVGIAGLEKAVEVLDVLGSGVANLNSSGLISGTAIRGKKISVLAFEVANTITRGASLMQSLSEDNVRHVKKNIFNLEGVQCLISTDIRVLQSIAASDKREELEIFCREVIRFGDLCKDPQWHNLNRFFSKLESKTTTCITEKADQKMCDLTILAQQTAELYHELNALDRFEQDCQQQREEAESFNLHCQESLVMLQSELKQQKRLVMSLKRKSLWSKRMEEVIEKLVDVVIFIHHQISESFENIADLEVNKEPNKVPERLGAEGLALHYAKVINQIDNIASRPTSLPPSTRDSLYRGLSASVKNALHCSLRRSEPKEELSVPQIKAEMGKTLDWLVPMATSTSKLYQGFGWVGEWAVTSNNFHTENDATTTNIVRLETLYHADKEKTDACILELVEWLHHLITAVKRRDYEDVGSFRDKTTYLKKSPPVSLAGVVKPTEDELSKEERNLIEKVSVMQHLPISSKSQRVTRVNRRSFKMKAQFVSSGTSPCRELNRGEGEEVDENPDLSMLRPLYLVI